LPEHLESITVWGSKNPLLSIGNLDIRLDHDVALEDIVEKTQIPGGVERRLPNQG